LSFTSLGPIPTGDFLLMEVGGQIVYGKLMVPGDHSGAYLAINRAAAQAAIPAAAEAAFLNPLYWTWADGSTGLPGAGNRVLTSRWTPAGGHDIHETWTIPSSNPLSDNVILYTANYESIDGPPGIGCAASTPECLLDATPPSVISFTLKVPPTSPTGADTLVFLATFSEAVTGVDTADFSRNGTTTATVTNVTQVTPSTYDVTISGGDLAGFNGIVGLDLSPTPTITDLAGNALPAGEPAIDQTYTVDNTVSAASGGTGGAGGKHAQTLPLTGFAPNIVTSLPPQPTNLAYSTLGDLWLEIPSQNVKSNIVGVPQSGNAWDVTWLGSEVGGLNGTAFPTWSGNSVLTGHVWNADNTPGVFVHLKNLKYSDQIKIHAFGQLYIYEVSESRIIRPSQTDFVFQHEERPYLTLLTCEDYHVLWGNYSLRRMVRAVLVEVQSQ
jgi:LPXTG-site transpeptidase (sortase) family protein